MSYGKRGAYLIAGKGNPADGGGWTNQQLLKDCGLVPYLLYKNHGFHSVLVGMRCSKDYPYLERYLRGLELDFLPEDTLQARTDYINAHADDMDLLILYGATKAYIPLVEYYRRVRPDGKIYLATDMNIIWADRIAHEEFAYKNFFHSCDVVAASCRATQKYLSIKWSVPVDLIRNGWYNFADIKFDDTPKENIILNVGRLGSFQKKTNILLEAFAAVADELPDWNLRLVGGVEKEFIPWLEKFFSEHLNLRGRVTFSGLLTDRAALMAEYKRAKIFCLTSSYEGAPNVAAEALFAGDYIITSAVQAAGDMVDDGNCGQIFPINDTDALIKIFREVCPNADLIRRGGRNAAAYAREQFDAEKIVARLNYLLYGGDAT